MIVVLSDDQLQRIEDALESARAALIETLDAEPLLLLEMTEALALVKMTRAAMAA